MNNYHAIIDAIAMLYVLLTPLVWLPYVIARIFVKTSTRLRLFALFCGIALVAVKTITLLALGTGDGLNYNLLILAYIALIADVSISSIAMLIATKKPLFPVLHKAFLWIAVVATTIWYINFLTTAT